MNNSVVSNVIIYFSNLKADNEVGRYISVFMLFQMYRQSKRFDWRIFMIIVILASS